MKIAAKIRLHPTPEQEELFRKSAGTARFCYNFYLGQNELLYAEHIANGNTGPKSIGENAFRKILTQMKHTTHPWLGEVGSNVAKQAVKDAATARERFFKGLAEAPNYKAKHYCTPSFYVNYESLKAVDGGFCGERLGFVKTAEPLPTLMPGKHYSNPRITYDKKYWYLSVTYDVPDVQWELTGERIGIDVGVKELAVVSDGTVYANINKTKEVKRLEKKLRREQRQLSRMLESNTAYYVPKGKGRAPVYKRPLDECKNIIKQRQVIAMLYRRLTNIRENYLHQVTSEIVKTKPSCIVLEDLNVRGMMKSHHLAKALQDQKLGEFGRMITYKAQLHGIEVIKVPRFYPSSKTCSCCGHVKKDLKLRDRTYRCQECGFVMDRDLNAAISLKNYPATHEVITSAA